jgi:3-oxoacyl-ACP reductase-like protein
MGIFSSIKDAIFGKKAVAAEPAAPAAPNPVGTALDAATSAMAAAAAAPPAEVDVDAILTAEAAGKDLNWRTSIVDLMKLLGIDSSLANRKELATELGYTGALDGSAEMNIWLHKAVMRELVANGGKVPADLTD